MQTNAMSDRKLGLLHGATLSMLCVISYWLITHILPHAGSVSHDDDLLGGMWSVVATVFVYRYAYEETISAALSRISATLLSFVLCFVYLLIWPFTMWGMAALIGIGAVVMVWIDRREDVVTTGITTAVVMVVAGLTPEHAWREPVLRVIDTLIGTGVAIFGALISPKPMASSEGMH